MDLDAGDGAGEALCADQEAGSNTIVESAIFFEANVGDGFHHVLSCEDALLED